MDQIFTLVSNICQPNPEIVKEPSQRSILLKKNKAFFWTFLWVAITLPIFSLFSNELANAINFLLIPNFINLFLFMLLCRSYLWVFYIYVTAYASILPMVSMNLIPDMMFTYLAVSFLLPSLILIITANIWFTLMTGAMQIFTLLTTFKRIFKEKLQNLGPENFSEQFVTSSTIMIIFMGGLFLSIVIMLKKKTEELVNAHRETEEALDHQKTFLFSFSHELRNPINSLLGNLQLLLMSNLSPDAKEMVRTAQICGELLLQLINNVLDAGKSNIGKLEITPAPAKVHDLFQRIWAISNELISRKQLKSHLKIEKKVPPILLLDSHRVNQLMMNLIGNAIKFTERGSITITVKWLAQKKFDEICFEPIPYDDDGLFEKEENFNMMTLSNFTQQTEEHLVLNKIRKEFTLEEIESPTRAIKGVLKITITDTGCGMDNNALARLFQKFSQVSADTRKRQIGTGLGLFITKEICKQMGGDARAYSKPPHGSTFVVCIPTSSVSSLSQTHLGKSISTIQTDLSQQRLKTIVADDSPFNVNLVCNFFSKINALVVGVAGNGFDAYQRYVERRSAGERVDVITLDIDMPKMDGKTACQKIREYERTKGITPTIIMLISGNYDEQQVNDYLEGQGERRADYFLKKPLIFEEFCSALYRIKN